MSAIFGQNVDADLIHILAVSGASRKTNELAIIISTNAKNIKFFSFFAKSIAPLGEIKFFEIFLMQNANLRGQGSSRILSTSGR